MNFDDWIRIQLRSPATAGPAVTPRPSPSPAGLALLRQPGAFIQGAAAAVAIGFFAFGVLAGVPTPSLHLDILPEQAQEIPITSLAIAPAPPAAVLTVSEISARPLPPVIAASVPNVPPPRTLPGAPTVSTVHVGSESKGQDGHAPEAIPTAAKQEPEAVVPDRHDHEEKASLEDRTDHHRELPAEAPEKAHD